MTTTTKTPTKEPGFIGALFIALAPPENRVIATVAGVRTFGQTLRGSTFIAGIGGVGLTAADVAAINWTVLLYGLIGVLGASTLAGLDAFFNVLANGLSKKYTQAVVEQVAQSQTQQAALAQTITDAAAVIDASGTGGKG